MSLESLPVGTLIVYTVNITALGISGLFAIMFFVALLLKKKQTRSILCIALIFIGEIAAIVFDLASRLARWFQLASIVPGLLYVLAFASATLVFSAFYWYFLAHFEEKGAPPFRRFQKHWIVIYAAVFIAIFASSLWTDRYFDYSQYGVSALNARYRILLLVYVIPLEVLNAANFFRFGHLLKKRHVVMLVLYSVMPVVGLVLDMILSMSTMYVFLAFAACMFYIYVETEQERELAETEHELAQSQLNALAQQINPHFIYNTLGSIDSLCRTDPEAAQRLVAQFSDYLWDNYTEMGHNMIPFPDELKHLDHYLCIEQVRFPNLHIEYEVECEEFLIPSMTIQPLAENAVKHGICKRRRSEGTLTVAAAETETDYVVTVRDNGVGFDPAVMDDGKPHIGIENVKKRLSMLCGGSLTITSTPGKGTICEIKLPKGGTTL